ncbi:MAG: hypothetical protein AABX98_02720, partial [Nanoarchaeota archaeon]
NLDHLDEIDKKVKEVKEERRQQKIYEGFSPVIRRSGERYYVLLTLSSGSHGYTYDTRKTSYDLVLFDASRFVDVLPLSSFQCNAARLRRDILSENKKEYDESPYMKELEKQEGIWRNSEIPRYKRSIKEIQETGVSIIALTKDRYGIPRPCFGASEGDLRSTAFLAGANFIVGYRRTLSFDKEFPFIHIVHKGYPVIMSTSHNPQNPAA